MRLSERERRVLQFAEFDARQTAGEISRAVGLREHSVRYTLKRLVDRGAAAIEPFVDVYPLGYRYYNVFFSLGLRGSGEKAQLLDELVRSEQVAFLAELGGDYQYELAICARDHLDAAQFLQELSGRYPAVFFDKAVACRLSFTRFRRGWLGGGASAGTEELSFGYPRRTYAADQEDFAILSALSSQPFKSRRELARRLRRPFGSVEHRLSRLERAGIVKGYTWTLDPRRCGLQSYKLLVFAKGLAPDLNELLLAFAKRQPNAVYLISSFGSWDFEIALEVEDGAEVLTIAQALFDELGSSINTVRTLAVFRRLKFSFFPQLYA